MIEKTAVVENIKHINENIKNSTNFLQELTDLSNKYGIFLDSTDYMYMEDDSGVIGDIYYDNDLMRYYVEEFHRI